MRDKVNTFLAILTMAEHIMPKRYGCLFATLAAHSHPGTAVYMHTPTPETQLNENGQFFENVVPQHVLVTGMAFAGFQLERFDNAARYSSSELLSGIVAATRARRRASPASHAHSPPRSWLLAEAEGLDELGMEALSHEGRRLLVLERVPIVRPVSNDSQRSETFTR